MFCEGKGMFGNSDSMFEFFLSSRVIGYALDAANGVKELVKEHLLCEFDVGVNDEIWN
jgi:hypothetical protein